MFNIHAKSHCIENVLATFYLRYIESVLATFYLRYGYADFATTEEAQSALELTDSELDGRKIRIDISTPRGSGTPRGSRGGRGEMMFLFAPFMLSDMRYQHLASW